MRWERLPIQSNQVGGGGELSCDGPGKRWGHTCNAIRAGKLLYVFGGYDGKLNRQTNQVYVFDAAKQTWSQPVMKGTLPLPRDSHSCTTVGDNLFVFGGTDGKNPLNDLNILETSSNTWISPSVRGEGPKAREGHSAALVGKRLLIFGGCGQSANSSVQEYYDDLYILNTETFVWKLAATSGSPPVKRDSHTCSSWKNKFIVIGGEDSSDYYMSDVHILDADTLVWTRLNMSGQLLPPRAGHTTVALGKNLFVFGGFSDEQNLYDDMYMFDVDTGFWSKVMATGEGPSSRFSMAGDCLDPERMGTLFFFGGCNKDLEALDDMYFLYTGFARQHDRDGRRSEKLSLRKQLKLKCQEQHGTASAYDKALVVVEPNVDHYQPAPVPYIQPCRWGVNSNESQNPQGKRTFQAKVTKRFPYGYTIETVIDGKPLCGVLFSDKLSFSKAVDDDSSRKRGSAEMGSAKLNEDQNEKPETVRPLEEDLMDDRQEDGVQSVLPDPPLEASAVSSMKDPAPCDATQSH